MNEEEKESVEEFRKQLRLAINIDDVTTAIRNDNAQTILNLIEKLQKENGELKLDIENITMLNRKKAKEVKQFLEYMQDKVQDCYKEETRIAINRFLEED